MMDKAEDLVSGTFYLTIMQASHYVVALLFYVLVARVLSPGEVGSFSLLLMVMGVFNTVTLLALNSAVIRFVSEGLGRGDVGYAYSSSAAAFRVLLCVSLPVLFLGFAFSPLLSSYLNVGMLDVVCMLSAALILNLTSFYGAVMLGYSLFREVSLQNILFVFLSRFLGLVLAYPGLRVLGLSLGFLVGSLVTLLYSIFVLRGRVKYSVRGFSVRRLFGFSLPLYGYNIVGLVQGWLDVAILSSVAGLGGAGTYYIAVSSVAPLTILWAPLSSALFPTLSSLNGSGDEAGFRVVSVRTLRVATAVVLPLSAALSSVSYTALSIVYGSRYAEASIPFSILAAVSILGAYSSIYSTELQSKGSTRPILLAGLLSVAIYVLLLTALAAPFKQIGAALARAGMVAVGFAVLYRKIDTGLPENLWRSVLGALLVATPLLPIELLWDTDVYLKASVELAVLAGALALTYKFVKPLSGEDLELLKAAMPMKLKQSRFW
jgi:O-antigen/teichoic acid export membrane protein